MQPSALAIINYNVIQPATFFKHCPQAKVWRFATQSKFCLTLSRLKYACFHANPVQTSRKFRTVRYGVYFRKSSTPIHRVNVFCIKTTIISASAIVRMLFSVIVHNVYRIRSSLMCTKECSSGGRSHSQFPYYRETHLPLRNKKPTI